MDYHEWVNKGVLPGKNCPIESVQELPTNFPFFSVSTFNDAVFQLRSRLAETRYFSAPMTHASGAAFRQLIQGHMTEENEQTTYIGFTQMYTADALLHNSLLRDVVLSTAASGEKVILQLCGNNPFSFRTAAELLYDSPIASQLIALDINLGCPASCASSRGYGFYVTQNWPLVHRIISETSSTRLFPVTCKIRPLNSIEKTVDYMLLLVMSGASGITIHMRHTTRQGKHAQSVKPAYLEFEKLVHTFRQKLDTLFNSLDRSEIAREKSHLYPVIILNGGIKNRQEADHLLTTYPADGVMLGVGLLKNPTCLLKHAPQISGKRRIVFWIKEALKYLDLCESLSQENISQESPLKVTPMAGYKEVIGHTMRFMQNVSAKRFNEPINKTKSITELREFLTKVLYAQESD
ncbi:Embryo-related protein [Giardia lamblia P15]|uniref:Embryo-related protein n=1 Tax=Giardia intestinalis (strain P15) TaxID=658858 RepID=E1F1G1_GIAIA|nr:Embryo-related protein [Giardia lamblia P15]